MSSTEPTTASEPRQGDADGAMPVQPDEDTKVPYVDRRPRVAAWVFAGYLVVSFFLLLLVLGSHRWFMFDEWEFLANRTLSPDDLFRPHYQHWTTLPLVVYRLLWEAVGAQAYWPYQVPVVAAHLGSAWLIRVVMRRAGVSAWVATVAAASFVLFGTGQENIIWGFQLTLTGALAFGLIQLVLADHDGPIDRRDGFALVAGLASLLCSGVGVTMVAIVGLAVLLRRGWLAAALQVLPLAAVYVVWSVFGSPELSDQTPTVGEAVDFVVTGFIQTLDSIGYVPGVGIALGIVLVVGLALAWLPHPGRELRGRAAAPLAMLLGSFLFLGSVAWSRAWLGDPLERNQHLVAALILPVLAIATDAIIRRWQLLTPVVLVLFLIGIPANVDEFRTDPIFSPAYFDQREQLVTALPRTAIATNVPRSLEPDPGLQGAGLTMGWLLDAVASGDLPEPPEPITPQFEREMELRLGVTHVNTFDDVPDEDCETTESAQTIELARGDRIGLKTAVTLAATADDGTTSPPTVFDPFGGAVLEIEADDLTLVVTPAPGQTTATICR